MAADLETIVQRMIDAGEPEGNIAAVISEFKSGETAAPQSSNPPTPLGLATGSTANMIGRGAVRAGEEIATSPLTGKAVNAMTGQAAQYAARAAGTAIGGGLPGYAAGEVAAQGLKLPVVRTLAEGALRSGGEAVAGVGRVLGRAALPVQAAMTAHDIYQLMTPESRAAMAVGRNRVAAADAASGRRDARDMDRSRRRRMTTAEIARDEINKRK